MLLEDEGRASGMRASPSLPRPMDERGYAMPSARPPPHEKGPRVFLDYDPGRARRRLRSGGLSAQHPAAARPLGQQQRANPRPHRPAAAPRLRAERDRGARHFPHRRRRRRPRSLCSSMAARGAPGGPRPMPRRPRCSSAPAPIMSCRISPGCRIAAAACCRWPTRCAARSPGSTATRRALAATPTGSMSAVIPRARISPPSR